ncbi:MAG: twin-arginine translocation signal domain-containing protein, partial [Clostridia bacterium]|nr:twin-arginine translocation signal domain-containing protein [Clostridia bacterium]
MDITRRSFLKSAAAGAAGIAALGVTGLNINAKAEPAAAAHPVYQTVQQMLSKTLNPQKCDIFTKEGAGDIGASAIFSPWQFGRYTIENRIVKSAAGSAYLPTETKENIIEQYTNWAKGGVKLIWIEDFINLHRDFPMNYKYYSREDAYLSELTEAIHAQGSICGYQLMLMNASFSGFTAGAPGSFDCAHADHMTLEELKNLQDNFIDAALYLKEQGVDAIEINAAGNNIGQAFLSRSRNARTDEYGPQTIENRARFLTEIIAGIKNVCGEDFPVQILINGIEENDSEIGQNGQLTTVEENCEIAKMLE